MLTPAGDTASHGSGDGAGDDGPTSGEVFHGGGETGALMRATDWSATPLGPVHGWPRSLRAAVGTVLSSRYPMLLLWGDQLTQLYNDAYSALIGDKHPAAMGDDVRVTLAEGWDVLGPIIDEAMRTGVASWVPGLRLLLERAGYREEAYFTVSHGPARDDDGRTVGVLTVCSEVTDEVVGQRRLRLLREVSARGSRTAGVAAVAADLLSELRGDHLDVPFAELYLADGPDLVRTRVPGPSPAGALPEAPDRVRAGQPSPWGLTAAAAGRTVVVDDVAERSGTPGGPFSDPVRTAVAVPLASADPGRATGVLLLGTNPARALDDDHRAFLELLAQQVATALRDAHAYAEEVARAEALAELDRVKTDFFTGVSHEFRTPLTLMLGPLQDALDDAVDPLPPGQRERVRTARRNAGRMLALVNDLLTFASIEAGGAAASPRTVDLARLTTEVTSPFRAASERAGLRLVVRVPPGPLVARTDPLAWERIVTNLVSNALKHTFVGSVEVGLTTDGRHVRLEVVDTGIGIAAEELPRLFERFHRVRGSRSRSHEGSGIGLALVAELVRQQGGEVTVTSEPGEGSTFEVQLPLVPAEPPAPAGAHVDGLPGASAAVAHPGTGEVARTAAEEALGWLPGTDEATGPPSPGPAADAPARDKVSARVVVADDNSDMRAYLARLLSDEGWTVEAVPDGAAALEALRREHADLLLTDVMMPRMDGFELLREVRRDPRTSGVPVVVLSARAGAEASVEGLDLGADDYVVKPFAAGDLLARARTTMLLARQRSAHTATLSSLADTAAVITSGRSLEQAVQGAADQARRLFQADRVEVRLVRPDGGGPLRFASPAGTRPHPGASSAADVVEVPLPGRDGAPVGDLTAWSAPRGWLGPEARALMLPVAQMLASLAETSWQVEREHHVALTLQRALLPQHLPQVPGLGLATRYRPGTADMEVGGDWFDVVPLPDGRLLLSVGDVSGKGLDAATTMGQVRNAVRAFALDATDPAAVVARLDTVVERLEAAALATVWLGYLDVAGGELVWCSAGHPPAVVASPGVPARWLVGDVDPPLGAPRTRPPAATTDRLAPGELVLLYTDGLVEDRAQQLDGGMAALLTAVDDALAPAGPGSRGTAPGPAASPDQDAEDLLGHVLDSLRGPGTPAGDDLVALLVRRAPEVPRNPLVPLEDVQVDARWEYPASPAAARAVRRDVRQALEAAQVDDDTVEEMLLAASEAVNNAVEHAQDPARPEVVVTLAVSPTRLRVTVTDTGRWRRRTAAMDRGHGSALMSAFCEVHVTSTPEGTTVVLERATAP